MPWNRGKAYSQDLRERVFAFADDSFGVCEIAEQLLVSVSYVSKVLGRRRLTTPADAPEATNPGDFEDHTVVAAWSY